MERSESIPQLSNIKFSGKFQGIPEYSDSYKAYNHFTKNAPIKAKDHLRVNTAVISPTISQLSEYTDKFKEMEYLNAERRKHSKQISTATMRSHLLIDPNSLLLPEYNDNFKDPKQKKPPEHGIARSPILSMSGDMDYNPEYR